MTRDWRAMAASPAVVLARRLPPDRSINLMRSLLMDGYGKGASEGVVTSVTRDRPVIGDMTTWSRRARTAQRTRDARDGWTGILPRISRRIPRALVTVGGPALVVGLARMLRGHVNSAPAVRRRNS